MKRFLALLCATFISSVVVAEVEYDSGSFRASSVTIGVPMRGQLATHDEVDWFIVDIPAGHKEFSLEVRQTAPQPMVGQWAVTVYDAAGTPLSSFSSWLTEIENRTIDIAGPGRFRIGVSVDSFHSAREYLLTAKLMPVEVHDERADFSGIWVTDEGHYVSIDQSGSEVVAAVLGDSELSRPWEALTGSVSGNQLSLSTMYGYVNMSLRLELLSSGLIRSTQISCAPVTVGHACERPNGSVFTAVKEF